MSATTPYAPPSWAPTRRPPPSVAQARATTNRVARTFAIACRLLPRGLRDDVYLLYLVFRTLDDLVDDGRPEAEARIEAVEAWAARDLGPATPETATLSALAARHPLPRDAVADFCAGMRQDLAEETFPTQGDVDRYCYRVAGTVGLVMTAVLGARDPHRAQPAAIALGMAMQRTNILRDIDEDADHGRVYLAQEAIERHGPPLPGRRAALVRQEIARADALYDRGLSGVRELRHGRLAIGAAGGMYREILRQIERDGYGAEPGRAAVSRGRKLAVAARAARFA
jgi:phytoene synthase